MPVFSDIHSGTVYVHCHTLLYCSTVAIMQHSDSVIAQEYSGMSGKGEGRSQVRAQIVGDRVAIQSTKGTPNVTFDRTPTQVMHWTAPSSLKILVYSTCSSHDIIMLCSDHEERCSPFQKNGNGNFSTAGLPPKATDLHTNSAINFEFTS